MQSDNSRCTRTKKCIQDVKIASCCGTVIQVFQSQSEWQFLSNFIRSSSNLLQKLCLPAPKKMGTSLSFLALSLMNLLSTFEKKCLLLWPSQRLSRGKSVLMIICGTGSCWTYYPHQSKYKDIIKSRNNSIFQVDPIYCWWEICVIWSEKAESREIKNKKNSNLCKWGLTSGKSEFHTDKGSLHWAHEQF